MKLSNAGMQLYDTTIFTIPQDLTSHPADGVMVYGMQIEGASWDHESKRLCDPRADQMRSQAPIMHFVPETDHELNPGKYPRVGNTAGAYSRPEPLRKRKHSTTTRTNNITLTLTLTCQQNIEII